LPSGTRARSKRLTATQRKKGAAFAELAREYCRWADGPPGKPRDEWYRANLYLAKLYLAGLELPVVDHADHSAETLPLCDYDRVRKRFVILPLGSYFKIFDPFAGLADGKPEEPVVGGLGDDLADIYRDLKRALALWDLGQHRAAIWEWKFNFGCHWSEHATSALRALRWAEDKNGDLLLWLLPDTTG
jgi:hypothetical protein